MLAAFAALALAGNVVGQPLRGSHLSPDQNSCAMCHGEADLWEGETQRLFISPESLADDVHRQKGVNCHDCHGGNPGSFDVPEAHSTKVLDEASGVKPFRLPLSEVRKACGTCHQEQKQGLETGVHAEAGETGPEAKKLPLDCGRCHGEKAHGILAVGDARSATFPDHQVELCGGCHEAEKGEYLASVHGQGLERAGLMGVAVCASCHGAHGIFPAQDKSSSLYPAHVAHTCGKCHRFIEERLQRSVHGNPPKGPAQQPAPAGPVERKPTCTDCHQKHERADPPLGASRPGGSDRCGDCHAESSPGDAVGLHAKLTDLGYVPAAKCSGCHGAHDVLPISDPRSSLSPASRQRTCKKCHVRLAANLVNFDPHADYRDPRQNPVLRGVYMVLMILLLSVFTLFGVHSLLWFVRSLLDVLRNGRPRRLAPGSVAYFRFDPFVHWTRLVLLLSFLGLAMTGLPLKYGHHEWGQALAYAWGGFGSVGLWHRIFGMVNIGCLVGYLVRGLSIFFARPRHGAATRGRIFGPDGPLPSLRDAKDLFRTLRWCIGRGPKPTFERWAYWEKFDFWTTAAVVAVIGLSGAIIWFPNLFCSFLPGRSLNVAKVVHTALTLPAAGLVFALYYFNTHFRPEKFPADMSTLTGLVDEEELRQDRPEFWERMRLEGKLGKMKAVVPSRLGFSLLLVGWTAVALVGAGVLAGILLALLAG